MKVAFVYDHVNKFGGAERVLMALHEIWPDAPLYTAVYDDKNTPWASSFQVKTSFLKHIPFIQKHHEFLPFFTPYAFESMKFTDYDVVISITSADAKGVITPVKTMHICYCLTPTRYLWSGYYDYHDEPGLRNLNKLARIIMNIFFRRLRQWDFIASRRPDRYIAISRTVADRIKTYYQQAAEVIYPPLNFISDNPNTAKIEKDYFLIVSRLVPYKKIDYVISAFAKLGSSLIIIGNGLDKNRLEKIASENILFLNSDLTDEQLGCYYRNCTALIFPGEEDFGLTAVEVQAHGRPVIGYRSGGIQESIIEGITGEYYDEANANSLITAIKRFNSQKYKPSDCIKNANRFLKKYFKLNFKNKVEKYYSEYKINL